MKSPDNAFVYARAFVYNMLISKAENEAKKLKLFARPLMRDGSIELFLAFVDRHDCQTVNDKA